MQKEELQGTDNEVLDSYMCPSFNSYSTDQLATIAEQVGQVHYRAQNDDVFTPRQNDDFDFEFVAFRKADDEGVFFDDTVFPLFDRELLREHRNSSGSDSSAAKDAAAFRFPMGRLLIGGGDGRRSESHPPPPRSSSSSSSSESDDLEGIPAGTYCVWTPNSPQASPSRCKKSNSTGSSSPKRWKLLDLLRRSNSAGKESLVILRAPSSSPAKKKEKEQWSVGRVEVAGKPKAKGSSGAGEKKKVSLPAHEALYLRNRELRRVDKKRSFLPYRQDLVGFCTSRLGKTFPSF